MAHRRGRPGDDQQSRAGYATTTAASAQDQTITLKATAASLTCIPIPGQNLTGQEVPGDQCVFSEKPTRNEALYRHLRAKTRGSSQRRRGVVRFPDHLKAFRLQQRSSGRPEAIVVIDDQHRERHPQIVARRAPITSGPAL